MTAAIAFMSFAAVRAQTAYLHRHDGPGVYYPLARSAIILAVAGVSCFLTVKVMS